MSAESLSGRRVALLYFSHTTSTGLSVETGGSETAHREGDAEVASAKETLLSLGCEVVKIGFKNRLREFIDLLEFNRPDVALNLCRPHPSYPRAEIAIPGVLDLMKIPYTGPDSYALALARDVEGAAEHLATHSVPLRPGRTHNPPDVSIALLGNGSPRVLSPLNGKTGRMGTLAAKAYALLRLRDCALVDFSLDADGSPELSGFSPIPELSPESPLTRCAEASGLSYPRLIDEIVTSALHRAGR